MDYILFFVFSYLTLGFGIVIWNNMGLTLNENVKFTVFWLPLLLVYIAYLRRMK